MCPIVSGDGFPLNRAIVTFLFPTAIPSSYSNSTDKPSARSNHCALLFGLVTANPKWPTVPSVNGTFSPALLLLDEIGYLPIDQRGADLLFQVISQRYERGSIVLTSNKAFKQWATIFNGDSTITSAVLDRLLHHAEAIIIEGSSYRMKDRIET